MRAGNLRMLEAYEPVGLMQNPPRDPSEGHCRDLRRQPCKATQLGVGTLLTNS